PNEPQPLLTVCPVCRGEVNGMLELLPGRMTTVSCSTCRSEVQLTRAKNEVRAKLVSVRTASPEIMLNDDLLMRVRLAMPPQPWPKGAAKDAAARLGLPHDLVSTAIQRLISNGTFQLQIDGKLYKQIESPEPLSSPTGTVSAKNSSMVEDQNR